MPVESRLQVGPVEAHVGSRIAAKVLVATILFAISLPAFYQQTLGTGGSDIPTHFWIARDSQNYPHATYSILSVFVRGLFWAGGNSLAVGWIAILLLSACVALKGLLSVEILSNDNERWGPAGVHCGRARFRDADRELVELQERLSGSDCADDLA
jgi:hypothetical protein